MREETILVLREFIGQANILAVPAVFVRLCGDASAAILLNQILYWSDRATLADGWFWKSKREWQDELGISPRILDRCQRELVELGLIETKVEGLPAVTHYRASATYMAVLVDFITQTSLDKTSKLVSTKGATLQLTEITTETTIIPAGAGPLEDHEKESDQTRSSAATPHSENSTGHPGRTSHGEQQFETKVSTPGSTNQGSRSDPVRTPVGQPWLPPGGVYGRVPVGFRSDEPNELTYGDETTEKRQVTDCEKWLVRLSGTRGRFTDAQLAALNRPYRWTVPDPKTHAIQTLNCPSPMVLFKENSPRGDDFRGYVSKTGDQIRNSTAGGRIPLKAILGIVKGWRYLGPEPTADTDSSNKYAAFLARIPTED